jgi:dTDP-4-dehydrorhamnose 3,5-epimerase
MKITESGFKDLHILEPKVLGDSRGYFMESYNHQTLRELGIDITFLQDNQSRSAKGVLRGLHFQRPPFAQTKLIRVLAGRVLDVVVDLRSKEPTFGEHFSVELSSENKKQLFVPKGFAHGFLVLSDTADVFYKCDELYKPEADGGIHYTSAGVEWEIPANELILSEKDRRLPLLKETKTLF